MTVSTKWDFSTFLWSVQYFTHLGVYFLLLFFQPLLILAYAQVSYFMKTTEFHISLESRRNKNMISNCSTTTYTNLLPFVPIYLSSFHGWKFILLSKVSPPPTNWILAFLVYVRNWLSWSIPNPCKDIYVVNASSFPPFY